MLLPLCLFFMSFLYVMPDNQNKKCPYDNEKIESFWLWLKNEISSDKLTPCKHTQQSFNEGKGNCELEEYFEFIFFFQIMYK